MWPDQVSNLARLALDYRLHYAAWPKYLRLTPLYEGERVYCHVFLSFLQRGTTSVTFYWLSWIV